MMMSCGTGGWTSAYPTPSMKMQLWFRPAWVPSFAAASAAVIDEAGPITSNPSMIT